MRIEGRSYALKYICQTLYNVLLLVGLYQLSINFNKWWMMLLIFVLSERIGNHDEVINIVASDEIKDEIDTDGEE